MTTLDSKLVEECTSNENGDEVIPEGWVKTTLQELLDVLESGSRPKGGVRGISEGIPSIGGEHLNSGGSFNFDSIKYVPQSFFDRMNQGHIQFNDILIVKDGATTAKVSLVREDFPFNPAVVNEHVFVCRPAKELSSPFLFYFLFSDEGQNRILENFRGSAQGGINLSFAAGTTVPLAPAVEQKRIVAKLEELLPLVNAAKERLNRTSLIMKHFRQAVLSAACTGRLTEGWREENQGNESAIEQLRVLNTERREFPEAKRYRNHDARESTGEEEIPDNWVWTSVDSIAIKVVDGVHKKPEYVSGGIPFITVRNLTKGLGIDFEKVNYISEIDHKQFIHRANPEQGDILVTKDGTLGVVRAIRTNRIFSIFVSVALIKPVSKSLTDYLELALSSPVVQRLMVATGSGLQHIHLRDLRNTYLPFPPLSEQQEIVRRVKSLFQLADAIEKRIEAAKLRADNLTQSILSKAFRGELVPNEAELARQEGCSYEPAEVLLERIKAEKEKKPSNAKYSRSNALLMKKKAWQKKLKERK